LLRHVPCIPVRFAVRDQSAWVVRTSEATTSLFCVASAGFRRSNRFCSSGCSRPSGGALSQRPFRRYISTRQTVRRFGTTQPCCGTPFRDESTASRYRAFSGNQIYGADLSSGYYRSDLRLRERRCFLRSWCISLIGEAGLLHRVRGLHGFLFRVAYGDGIVEARDLEYAHVVIAEAVGQELLLLAIDAD
jgi:hypothetical protein